MENENKKKKGNDDDDANKTKYMRALDTHHGTYDGSYFSPGAQRAVAKSQSPITTPKTRSYD